MNTRPTLMLAVALAGWSLPAPAQERSPSPEPSESIQLQDAPTAPQEDLLRRGHAPGTGPVPPTFRANSHWLAGRPISVGPDWKATYTEEGMCFTPALGAQAPRTRSLRWSLRAVEVGGVALDGLDLAAEPNLVEGAVAFARGGGLTELYEARGEGLEQSFLIERLPSRTGDLVVSGLFTTDLAEAPTALLNSSLRFEEPGIAAVRVSKVLAVDADGDRVEGHLRRSGGRLEIVVPADFVASAELPLLVDPLYGVEYDGTDGSFEADQVDVAFGASPFNEYALTFCRYFSATDPDIYAATYTTAGGIGLNLFAIEAQIGTFDQGPAIAYNAGTQMFAVVWQRSATPGAQNDVLLATFDATNATVQSAITIASGAADQRRPDVGGEDQVGSFTRVVVVYQDTNAIRVASVDVPSNAPPSMVNNSLIPSMNSVNQWPAITKSGGGPGVYFVTAEDDFTSDRDLDVALVNYLGGVLPPNFALGTIGPDEERPDIAGDGANALLVFQRESAAGTGDNDIIARKIEYDGFAGTLILDPVEIVVAGDFGDDEIEPAVGLSGNEYLVAWADQFGTSALYDIYARTVGADTCKVCEPIELVSSAAFSNREPEIGSRPEGGDALVGEAAIAYTRAIDSQNDEIYFRLWENDNGGNAPVNFGGGCGGAGSISFTGSTAIGSTDLVARLDGADPGATLGILNLNLPGLNVPCGSCSIVPPFLLFNAGLTSEPFGTKEGQVALGIPCDGNLAGKTLAFQWYVLPTLSWPCGSTPSVSFSDELRLTLGF